MACTSLMRAMAVAGAIFVSGWNAQGAPIVEMIREGDVEGVRAALAGGLDASAPIAEKNGVTPLVVAVECFGGDDTYAPEAERVDRGFQIVRMLLEAGADVNAVTGYGATALGAAADGLSVRSVELVQILLDAGADVSAPDSLGLTPLMMASRANLGIVRLLLASGADPNATDVLGATALHHALSVVQGLPDKMVIAELIQAGADTDARDQRGWTPFHVAARFSDAVTLLMFVVLEADTQARTTDGWTPVMIAAASNDPNWQMHWLTEEETLRAAALGPAPNHRGHGLYAAMMSMMCDQVGPASKVWALIRRTAPDLDAVDNAGRSIDDLVAKRTDPEAAAIRAMLELARGENLSRDPWEEEQAIFTVFPRPEGLPEPPQPDRPAR